MSGKLLPPPELAPPYPHHLTSEQCIEKWVELCEAAEQFVIAGLQAECGPGEDWRDRYRDWYRRRMDEHDENVITMLRNMGERENRP